MKKISLLREKLEEFYKITSGLITAVEEEKKDLINDLFISRQKIINEIDSLQYSKQDFVKYSEELKIIEISNLLEKTMHSKKEEIREKLNQLKEQKNANRSYIQNSSPRFNFLNKKV